MRKHILISLILCGMLSSCTSKIFSKSGARSNNSHDSKLSTNNPLEIPPHFDL